MELGFVELTKEMITPTHVADINNLLSQLSADVPICTPEWLSYMFESGTRLFAALDGEKIIGTVVLSPAVILVGQKDWIEDVVVDEYYRRLGVAGKLMDMAEQASRARGATSVNLTSNIDRSSARRMYNGRGYQLRDTGVFRLTF